MNKTLEEAEKEKNRLKGEIAELNAKLGRSQKELEALQDTKENVEKLKNNAAKGKQELLGEITNLNRVKFDLSQQNGLLNAASNRKNDDVQRQEKIVSD